MKKRLAIFSCLIAFGFSAMAQTVPQVIPALQSWEGKKGKLELPENGRIVIDPACAEVLEDAGYMLAEDLKTMFGMEYERVAGKAKAGDIYMTLNDKDSEYGDESYRLTIGSYVSISAPAAKGAFWGTRTLLQMLHNQPDGLQKGQALDYPTYRQRGFMIDVGRKFFSMDFLEQYIKIMAFYKMNLLQVHLNDNGFVQFFDNDWNRTYAAFRLECDSFPGLTAKDGSYSKEEFKAFQKTAARYGIDVIPEIDVPAHSLAFTHYNPELAADNTAYGMDHLDLYKDEVYEFLDTLFAEYIGGEDPVFVGPYVHIGTDEYNRKEAEQFRHFTNYYINYIKKFGKTPVIWGSLDVMKGKTEVNLEGCYVNAWNYDWMNVQSALDQGAKVVNMCDAYLYIVPAAGYYYDFLNYRILYEKWTAGMMHKGEPADADTPGFMGSMFAVWNDHVGNGISQQDVHYRTFPALQLMSDKLWKGNNSENVPYEQFEALCRTTPEAPGINLLGKVEGKVEVTEAGSPVTLDGSAAVCTRVAEIGYPYSVEFSICPDTNPAIDAILFKGPHAEFITNWENTGKFAFRRDGYEFVFHGYRLPAGEWTKIRIEGDTEGTSLYVNGELAERLEGRIREVYNRTYNRKDRMFYHETLVFPLLKIGDEHMGFKGKISDVTAEQK